MLLRWPTFAMGVALAGGGGGGAWWLPGVAVQFDFVNDRYYWSGARKLRTAFAAFSLAGACSMNATGLVLDATAANFDVSVLLSALGVSFPLAMIVSATPTAVVTAQHMATIDDGATSNYAALLFNNATRSVTVVTANVAVSNVSLGGGTAVRTTIGGNFETNNTLESVDGSTGGAADIVCALPTVTTLRIGERPGNTSPWGGSIQHLAIYSGAVSQATLNANTALVHAL